LAREVVQDAQRERLAALAQDDLRVREALQATQADLAQRRAARAQAQVAADDRDRIADERDRIAGARPDGRPPRRTLTSHSGPGDPPGRGDQEQPVSPLGSARHWTQSGRDDAQRLPPDEL
jgi:hypothetical protein